MPESAAISRQLHHSKGHDQSLTESTQGKHEPFPTACPAGRHRERVDTPYPPKQIIDRPDSDGPPRRAGAPKVNEAINRAQQVIGKKVTLDAELVKQPASPSVRPSSQNSICGHED